jgi:microcystin degradation protein MlrC
MTPKTSTKVAETTLQVLVEVAKAVALASVPFGTTIAKTIENSSKDVDAASDKGIEELRQELSKQELRLGFDLQQAKIAQEMAIAHRIMNAETVEIEEFYDKSASGQAGLGLNETGVNVGLRGDGKSVTKRIYKFSGHNISAVDITPSAIDDAPDKPTS